MRCVLSSGHEPDGRLPFGPLTGVPLRTRAGTDLAGAGQAAAFRFGDPGVQRRRRSSHWGVAALTDRREAKFVGDRRGWRGRRGGGRSGRAPAPPEQRRAVEGEESVCTVLDMQHLYSAPPHQLSVLDDLSIRRQRTDRQSLGCLQPTRPAAHTGHCTARVDDLLDIPVFVTV